MYRPEMTVLNHNPYIPFPVAFYFGPERISVRTFRPAPAGATAAAPEEALRILRSHMQPFSGPDDASRRLVLDGAALGEAHAGKLFAHADGLTVTRDPARLGAGVVSDRCDLVWLASREGSLEVPLNRTVRHLPDRRGRAALYTSGRKVNLLTLVTEYAHTRWEDALVVIKGNPERGLRIEFEGQEGFIPELRPFFTPAGYPRFGTLVLEGADKITAGGTATLTVRAVLIDSDRTDARCQSEVHIEMISGYAPHTRVKLRDGVGTFKVMALGLEAGETMRMKAGWRYFPGMAERIIRVTT